MRCACHAVAALNCLLKVLHYLRGRIVHAAGVCDPPKRPLCACAHNKCRRYLFAFRRRGLLAGGERVLLPWAINQSLRDVVGGQAPAWNTWVMVRQAQRCRAPGGGEAASRTGRRGNLGGCRRRHAPRYLHLRRRWRVARHRRRAGNRFGDSRKPRTDAPPATCSFLHGAATRRNFPALQH